MQCAKIETPEGYEPTGVEDRVIQAHGLSPAGQRIAYVWSPCKFTRFSVRAMRERSVGRVQSLTNPAMALPRCGELISALECCKQGQEQDAPLESSEPAPTPDRAGERVDKTDLKVLGVRAFRSCLLGAGGGRLAHVARRMQIGHLPYSRSDLERGLPNKIGGGLAESDLWV